MAAEGDAAEGMVSVQGFRRHYAKVRERMSRQTASVAERREVDGASAAAAGGALQLSVQSAASSSASQPRLDVSDLRTLSSYDQIERRIANRMAALAAQAAEAKQAAAAAEAIARAGAHRGSSPRSKKFEILKKSIYRLTPQQVAAMTASQRSEYNRLVAKIQAKEEGDRRLRAEQKRRAEIASKRHKQAAAAAASLASKSPGVTAVSVLDSQHAAGAAAARGGDRSKSSGTSPAAIAPGPRVQLDIDEVILTVRVFFHGRGAVTPAQELEVLGSQPLSALVDQISCLYDRPEVYSSHSWYVFFACSRVFCKQRVRGGTQTTNIGSNTEGARKLDSNDHTAVAGSALSVTRRKWSA